MQVIGNLARRCLSSSALSSLSSEEYLRRILTSRVYEVAKETPLDHAKLLSQTLDNQVYLKREDLQPVFSFKLRGAYNRIAHLTPEEKMSGIITCSAGNHAQGVALSSKMLGIDNTIVMPLITPNIKIKAVQQLGGNVKLEGRNFDESQEAARQIALEQNRVLVHPYDDPYVIAGQGTIGMEILKQTSGFLSGNLDYIFVCVGGGGLISGISVFMKSIQPNVKIIGVEAADAACMTEALRQDRRVVLDHVGFFADGAAVKQVGVETFRLAKQYVDEMVTVSTDEICAAIKDAFNDTRSILEPAGALSIAGMKKYVSQHGIFGKAIVAVASGANMNFGRLRFVAERSEQNEAFISVIIPEKPGSFREMHQFIHPRNVTGFSYRYSGPTNAYIYMSFSVSSAEETQTVINALNAYGFEALDLSNNEMAKAHARYLVGGRCPQIENEILIRIEFRETPGALAKFLSDFRAEWNVSLLHYRNHGSDIARVLLGIQVPTVERENFKKSLDRLGYLYVDESTNPAYLNFLK